MAMTILRRYWFNFLREEKASALNLGCGVTAMTRQAAEAIVRERVFPLFGERKIAEIIEDVQLNNLDPGHVLPNIGNTASVGVWFPAI